jgi:hypothetical protein
MDTTLDGAAIQAVAELVRQGTIASDYAVGGLQAQQLLQLFGTPDGNGGVTLNDWTDKLLARMETPTQRSGTVTIKSLASMTAFVTRMRQDNSILFADIGDGSTEPSLTCIFDYHDAVNPPMVMGEAMLHGGDRQDEERTPAPTALLAIEPMPRWARYRAKYSFPASDQWKVWAGKHQKPMDQLELAYFLEENIDDIVSPGTLQPGSKLSAMVKDLGMRLGERLDLIKTARGFSIRSNESVNQVVNTSTGEYQVSFDQTHTPNAQADGQPVSVPNGFLIGIPVFEGDAAYQLLARLRHQKRDNKVQWHYDLYRLAFAKRDAFQLACASVALNTGVPLFHGVAPDVSVTH